MNGFFMEYLFKRYILLLVICILPSSIRALNDPASLEAMIANHKKVRTLLEVRAIAELGVYEYHKQSSKKITDHRKVAEQLTSTSAVSISWTWCFRERQQPSMVSTPIRVSREISPDIGNSLIPIMTRSSPMAQCGHRIH